MNCLNGYFVASTYDSLAEAFLKAEGRGAIASFSPSGLSLDAPAHALPHAPSWPRSPPDATHDSATPSSPPRTTYAAAGPLPELLAIYHLLGDPAMRVRP